jgi:hypothetical protein
MDASLLVLFAAALGSAVGAAVFDLIELMISRVVAQITFRRKGECHASRCEPGFRRFVDFY